MGAQKVEHSALYCLFAKARTQHIRSKPGQRQESLGPDVVGQNPAQRCQSKRAGVPSLCRITRNCQNLSEVIRW